MEYSHGYLPVVGMPVGMETTIINGACGTCKDTELVVSMSGQH